MYQIEEVYGVSTEGWQQLEISPERSVQEIADAIIEKGYEPIFSSREGI